MEKPERREAGFLAGRLRFGSYLGDNGLEFYRQVISYLGRVTGLTAVLLTPPPDLDQAFSLDLIEAAFMCGLPYVRLAAQPAAPVRLLAAPIMAGERYGDRPVYFSDLIVHSASPYYRLADLRGTTFAYNQSSSLSGYVLPRHRLLALGETLAFFQAAVESGSHARSIDWVEQGKVAAAAIDSVVLEMELRQRPGRAASFRIVESIGPAPMPPVVAAARLPALARAQLIAALSAMHTEAGGQAILDMGGVRRFAPATGEHYAAIREILRVVEGVPA